MVLTSKDGYEPERTKKALLGAGADRFVALDPHAQGVTVTRLDESHEQTTAAKT